MRLPIKLLVLVVGIWIAFVAYLQIYGTPEFLYINDELLQAHIGVYQAHGESRPEVDDPDYRSWRQEQNMLAQRIQDKALALDARFKAKFYKASKFGLVILVLVVLGIWFINKFHHDPRNWDKELKEFDNDLS